MNFTFTIFAVALTGTGQTFHASQATTTWVMTAPLLSFGVVAPVLGTVGDRIGHRRRSLLGTVLTIVAAVLTATALSIILPIVARALSGIVGAATGTASVTRDSGIALAVVGSFHDAYLAGAVAGVLATLSAAGLLSRRSEAAQVEQFEAREASAGSKREQAVALAVLTRDEPAGA